MRPRIKHNIQLAGSSNYQTIVAHREELKKNHIENQATFIAINKTVELPKKSGLQLFEEWLKQSIKEYKLNKTKK